MSVELKPATSAVGGGAPFSSPGSGFRIRLRRADTKVSPYLYIAPFFVVFGIFGLFPLGYTAYISMTDRNLLSHQQHWIWFHNYGSLIHDSYFWNAVENTFAIWFISTVPPLCFALALAHVLHTQLD